MLSPIRQHRMDNSPQTLFPHPPMPRGEPRPPDNPRPCACHMRSTQQHVPYLPHPPHPAQHNVRGGVHVPILQGVTHSRTKTCPLQFTPTMCPWPAEITPSTYPSTMISLYRGDSSKPGSQVQPWRAWTMPPLQSGANRDTKGASLPPRSNASLQQRHAFVSPGYRHLRASNSAGTAMPDP